VPSARIRKHGGIRTPALALALLICLAPVAHAQIYTRTNSDGVIEATNVPDRRGFQLTYPGKGTLIHSRGFRGSYRGQYDHHVRDAAGAHGVRTELVHAVIQAESAYDHRAVSSKGACGLMQLMPATATRMGVSNAFDPRQNIFGGTRYLRLLLDMFGGNVSLALAAYNAGENAVKRYKGIPPFKETRRYVRKVRSRLSGRSAVIAFAPTPRATRKPSPAPAAITPAHPGVYYKWKDARGIVHVARVPPPEGITYATIRALQ
jgi:hypothetical protein